ADASISAAHAAAIEAIDFMAFPSLASPVCRARAHTIDRQHNDMAASNRGERTIYGRIGAGWKSSRTRCMAAWAGAPGTGTPMPIDYAPLRTLQDVEALERVPLEERIFSWDLNDWIARGCALDPDKVAIRYISDGDPESAAVCIRYAELQARATQAANLFHSLGVSASDTVIFVLPTLPQLYPALRGGGATGIACGVNWMLKPEQLGELVRATNAKVLITLGPTPGYEIWENVQAIRSDLPRSLHVLTVPGPGGATDPQTD